MKLTDEQRAGIARFLGFKEVAIVSKRFAPCHPYLIDADGTPEGERQWNDADLMLALMARAAQLGHAVYLGWDLHAPHAWLCTIGHGANPDTDGAVTDRIEGAAEAVIRGVLALEGVMP